MPKKFFNKTYEHAYVRGNKVWVYGVFNKQRFRIATGKSFNKANMNWAEKNYHEILDEYLRQQNYLEEQTEKVSFEKLMPFALDSALATASEGTVYNYRKILNKHFMPIFGETKIDQLTPAKFKRYQMYLINKSKLSRKSILNIRAAVSCLFRHAVDEEYIDRNIINIVSAPSSRLFVSFNAKGDAIDQKGNKIHDEIDPFTLDDVWKLVENAQGQFRNILTALFFTGMRPGELVTLRWDDIDWENQTIHIQRANKANHNRSGDSRIGFPKNGKKRKIDILEPVAKALQDQFGRTGLKRGFIFLGQNGERYMHYDSLRDHHWKNLLIQSGFDYREFYQTRHTFASIMLQEGEELAWVSKVMLGHSEISTTLKHYAKYIPDTKKKRAVFLKKVCTKRVQNENLNVEMS